MFDKNLLIGISLVLIWTCLDLRRTYFNQITPSSSDKIDQDDLSAVPPPTIKAQVLITVKIRYCFTCGYRNTFEQFSELARTHYPNFLLVGENHPPPPVQAFLAKGISMIKTALLICLLFGQNFFPFFRLPTPRIYLWALQNKMYACLMIFFFCSTLESYLMSTNTFEISINDILLWSKLETTRLPSSDEFIQMLKPFAT